MPLDTKDKALVRLYMASCFHRWNLLPDLGRAAYEAGCTLDEVRGCIRHLIVVAGYGPCLAATNHLHAAQLLEGNTPVKVGGQPGNAFELVYGSTTEAVRRKMFNTDPGLCELIRLHLYGDIYSSPGLALKQKQMLMVAFLAEADMHEQLFGHLIAALRFGNDKEACLKAIDIGFELSFRPSNTVYKGALKTLQLAYRKYKMDYGSNPGTSPDVFIADPDTIRVPPLCLSNGFDEFTQSVSHTFSTASLLADLGEGSTLSRTASEVDILNHKREIDQQESPKKPSSSLAS